MKKLKMIFLIIVCMGIASFFHNVVSARVDGACSICHTMHNSQDGESMIYKDEPLEGPLPHLLRGSCIGCHTGTNTAGNDIPYVYSTSEPFYDVDTLAGGNFWWVATAGGDDSSKGHNVYGLSEIDDNLTLAPGGGSGGCGSTSCHDTLAVKQTAVSSLGSGCEGCHLAPKHHANDSDAVVGEAGGWFRYCSGHDTGVGRGVEGIEDPDWQFTKGTGDHNEYLGAVGATFTGGYGFSLGNTMTGYCTGCHGNFHVEQNDVGAWIRHPSDAVIPNEGEYKNYTEYAPLTPVARPDLAGWTGPSSVVTPSTDLVMCLSCHRAHGSPYPDMLRWDYNSQVAGGGGQDIGCFKCHSGKN